MQMNKEDLKMVAIFLACIFSSLLVSYAAFGQEPETNLVPISQLTGFNPPNPGNHWKFTKPQEHHHAMVRIQAGNQGGSGAVIKTDKGMLVITNHHVIEGYSKAKIEVQDGRDGWLPVLWSNPNMDIALLYSDKGKARYGLPLGAYNAPYGEYIEMGGYAGPHREVRRGLRTFAAPRIRYEYSPMAIGASTVSGDSGGPMLHKGAIVGVNYGSTNAVTKGHINNPGGPWPLIFPACSQIDGPTLARTVETACSRWGCKPRIIYAPPGQQPAPPSQPNGPGYGYNPPEYNPPEYSPPEYNPPEYNPPSGGDDGEICPNIDYDKILELLAKDPRFEPLTIDDVKNVKIRIDEISSRTPLQEDQIKTLEPMKS